MRTRITKPEQVKRELKLSPEAKPYPKNADKWWSRQWEGEPANPAESEKMRKMFALREKLLSFGGIEACLPLVEEDYDAIMERGEFFYGSSYMRKGRPSRCHENASLLWDANRNNTKIATGYALSEDGLWRQHSWVVQELESGRLRVWETTVRRVAYFGFVMTEEECEKFLYWNT